MSLWDLINSVTLADLPVPVIFGLTSAWVYLFAAYIHPFFLQRNCDPKISVDGPISQVGLEALAVHRYKCSDYTFLDNLMNNWWIFAAKHLPLWIAPNVVTLLGFVSYLPTVVAITYFSSYTFDERPWWVYLMGAFSIFFYQTFDAMDGKHARATGAAGPLGQLFDHGIDAMAVSPATLLIATALRLDALYLMIVLSAMQVSFFMAQWMERYIHTLVTSVGGVGVTEGQLMGVFVMSFAAFGGPRAWLQTLGEAIGLGSNGVVPNWSLGALCPETAKTVGDLLDSIAPFVARYTCKCTLESVRGAVLCFKTVITSFNILAVPLNSLIVFIVVYGGISMTVFALTSVSRKVYVEKGCKGVVKAWAELLPTFLLVALNYTWFALSTQSTSTPAATQSVYASAGGSFFFHSIFSTMLIGSIFTHITCQMIISAMTQQHYAWINQPSFVPLIIMVALEYLSQSYPQVLVAYGVNIVGWKQFLYVFLVICSFFAQISWASRAAMQIAELFGIYVLRVGKWTNEPIVERLRNEIKAREDKHD